MTIQTQYNLRDVGWVEIDTVLWQFTIEEIHIFVGVQGPVIRYRGQAYRGYVDPEGKAISYERVYSCGEDDIRRADGKVEVSRETNTDT